MLGRCAKTTKGSTTASPADDVGVPDAKEEQCIKHADAGVEKWLNVRKSKCSKLQDQANLKCLRGQGMLKGFCE